MLFFFETEIILVGLLFFSLLGIAGELFLPVLLHTVLTAPSSLSLQYNQSICLIPMQLSCLE